MVISARPADMACSTDTKGLKSSSRSRQGWRFTREDLDGVSCTTTRSVSFFSETEVQGEAQEQSVGRWAGSISSPERWSMKPPLFWNETWLQGSWEQQPKIGKKTGDLFQGFKEENPGVPTRGKQGGDPVMTQNITGFSLCPLDCWYLGAFPLTQKISSGCAGSPLSACIKTALWVFFGGEGRGVSQNVNEAF